VPELAAEKVPELAAAKVPELAAAKVPDSWAARAVALVTGEVPDFAAEELGLAGRLAAVSWRADDLSSGTGAPGGAAAASRAWRASRTSSISMAKRGATMPLLRSAASLARQHSGATIGMKPRIWR
jgi:hypothetical protein